MERTNEQIDKVLKRLGEYWKYGGNAHLRLGQLIFNLEGYGIPYVEDDVILDDIDKKILDAKEYKINTEDTSILNIKPNLNSYCGNTEYPIYLSISDECDWHNDGVAGLSINNAKELINSLQEIVTLVENKNERLK